MSRGKSVPPSVVAIPAILVIGWIDYVTGPELGLSLLYLVPISITAWRGRRTEAIAMAAVAAACWLGADIAWRAGPLQVVSLWNGFTRAVIYTFTALLVHRLRLDREELRAMNKLLHDALERETSLARTDAVTGLANSRAFVEQLARELVRAARDNSPLSLLYLDLDGFKTVNDHYGHATGDSVLRSVADALRDCLSIGDSAARVGGDEFAILLRNAGPVVASDVARAISDRIAVIAAEYDEATLGVSVGVAHVSGPEASAEDLMRAADDDMYARKEVARLHRKVHQR